MSWFGRIRPALNWRVGLLVIAFLLVASYAASTRFNYHFEKNGIYRFDNWTGVVEIWGGREGWGRLDY